MMKENVARKLIRRHLAAPSDMIPGSEISLIVDHTLTHDINAVMAYLAFEALRYAPRQDETIRKLH